MLVYLPVAKDVPFIHIWNYDEANLTDDSGSKRVTCKRGAKYVENICNHRKSCCFINGNFCLHTLCIRQRICGLHGSKTVQKEHVTTVQKVDGSMLFMKSRRA
nr:unnamed protein product [Callosobruchus analis]